MDHRFKYEMPRNNISQNLDKFSDIIAKALSMKGRTDKQDFIKIKNICSSKDNIKRMRRQVVDCMKIFAKDI